MSGVSSTFLLKPNVLKLKKNSTGLGIIANGRNKITEWTENKVVNTKSYYEICKL